MEKYRYMVQLKDSDFSDYFYSESEYPQYEYKIGDVVVVLDDGLLKLGKVVHEPDQRLIGNEKINIMGKLRSNDYGTKEFGQNELDRVLKKITKKDQKTICDNFSYFMDKISEDL